MSLPGHPTQNARAESFFKTVKYEEVDLHHYQTFEEAQAHVQTFLEDVYNAKRLHSSLDYVPPDEFEAQYLKCSLRSGMDFLGALHGVPVNFPVKHSLTLYKCTRINATWFCRLAHVPDTGQFENAEEATGSGLSSRSSPLRLPLDACPVFVDEPARAMVQHSPTQAGT